MDLDDLRALLSVIEHGSASAAAEATRTSRTTLRRRLENLEATVGVPLLVRGTGGAVPTPAGLALAARGRVLVQEASAMVAAVRELDATPEGHMRVLVPTGLPPHLLHLALALARERLPRLQFRCDLAEDPLQELRDDVDLVLHFGPPPTHGPWVSTLLAQSPERLLASPDYLAQAGRPARVEELAQHTLLSWKPPGEDGRVWPLVGGGVTEVAPMFVSADVHLVRQLAAAGMGIALLPDGAVPEGPDIDGALVPVLPDRVGRPCALRALVPEAMIQLPKGRAVLDLVRELAQGAALAAAMGAEQR